MHAGRMRTFGNLRRRHSQFLDSGGNLRSANKHANVIHPSLISEEDGKKIISVIPIAELHILMGSVGVHIDLLVKIFGLAFIENWTKKNHILRHGYQGGGYNGNESKKILECLDDLEQYLPPNCAPIIQSMRALKAVIHGNKKEIKFQK